MDSERYDGDSPIDNVQHDSKRSRESSKHRSKDGKKSRREERDHNGKDKDWSKAGDDVKEVDKETRGPVKDRVSSREKRKDEKEEHQKHRGKGKATEKDHDRDKNREKDHERDADKRERRKEREHDGENEMEKESEWGREKERGKERNRDRDKEREREKRDRTKDKPKEMERDRHNDRDKEREYERDEKEKGKERPRDRERDFDEEKDKHREKTSKRNRDDGHDRNKDVAKEGRDNRDTEVVKGMGSPSEEESGMIIEQEEHIESASDGKNQSVSELKDRISRMKEERLQRKSEGSEVLSWVNKLGKLEERREEKQKALLRSKIFEEQDKIEEDDDDDQIVYGDTDGGLAGVKVLHGLDKVMEGGSVVLTLKDQHILADGDINEEVDMLENVEIGEQKQRDEAYKAAKKKTGIYVDKFNDQADSEKKMLPQYDDPVTEEGVTLDASGRFSGEAEKKLEELRRRLKGPLVKNQVDDLNSSVRVVTSDYYTPEEMLQFKKPKKKKSLRKKEKFDIDALEAEAIATGLGVADLGSRSDPNRQGSREEQERSEAEKRNSAYQAAKAKADEASQALRTEQAFSTRKEDVDVGNFADDADDYQKCLDRVRKVALTKQKEEKASGPEAIALIAASKTNNKSFDDLKSGVALESEVVITEMEEFVQGLHNDEEVTKPGDEDFFMEEDEAPKSLKEENREDAGGLADTEDSQKHVVPENDDMADVVADETIHEAPVGKGIAGALKLLKDRGALKETIEWGGRNMDKKKSKLVGIYDEGAKEINIERTDEYGRILTPKEAFRLISHKFHGKGPGKMKQEKRQKQYQDELKLKQMKNSDTPSESVERMREAQARMKTPYLILSGHVKPGQTSDPTSGFATLEKDLPGGLTPMLGDKKVEHFLGIKRKAETPNSGTPKKPKP